MAASSSSSRFGKESEFEADAEAGGGGEADLAEAQEIGSEGAGVEVTPSPEEAAIDLADHQVVSNGRSAESGAGDEGSVSDEAVVEAEDETSFETGTEWNPEERFPSEETAGADEALVEAYFLEAATEADAQEFLPILAALAPVVKAVAPMLLSTVAQQGTKLLADRLRRLKLRYPRLRLPPPPRPGGGRETDVVEMNEADLEAVAQALNTLEVVIGLDDRKRVNPTTAQPWRRICQLKIKTSSGGRALGTGFFIGRRTVMTAGHCVYMRDHGGWASEIQVTPALNVAAQPHGAATATAFRSVRGWTVGRKRECDYGCIILPRSFNQPAIGAFGFAAYPETLLKNKKLNLAGYPGDRPREKGKPPLPPEIPTGTTMWYHGRVAKSLSARVITYDTDTAGGQSGSPVWQTRNGKRVVVGIHTNGAPGGNSATRIIKPVYDNMVAWRRDGGD